MKGFGWLVILFALLTVSYLVVHDLDVLQGTRGERTVLEPLEIAKETTDLVHRTTGERKKRLDALDE